MHENSWAQNFKPYVRPWMYSCILSPPCTCASRHLSLLNLIDFSVAFLRSDCTMYLDYKSNVDLGTSISRRFTFRDLYIDAIIHGQWNARHPALCNTQVTIPSLYLVQVSVQTIRRLPDTWRSHNCIVSTAGTTEEENERWNGRLSRETTDNIAVHEVAWSEFSLDLFLLTSKTANNIENSKDIVNYRIFWYLWLIWYLNLLTKLAAKRETSRTFA